MSVLLQERRGPVALLTLNRPGRRNALSLELLAHLKMALTEVAAGDATVVVVTGSDPAFCAGLDLQELAGSTRLLEGEGVISTMRAVPQPVIAAVNGACVTGGLELALNCDVRIASERAPDPNVAEEAFERALSLEPDDWTALYALSKLLEEKREFSRAAELRQTA